MPTSDATPSSRAPLFDAFPPTPTEVWEEHIRKDLKGRDYEETLFWHPEPDLAVPPYYRRENLPEPPSLTAGRMRPDVELTASLAGLSLEEVHEHAITALGRGATALRLAIARDDRSWTGPQLFSLSDTKAFFEEIDLGSTRLHLEAIDDDGQTAPALLALLLEVQKLPFEAFRATIMMDPWASALSLGRLAPAPFQDCLAGLLRYSGEHLPKVQVLGIDAQPYHEGGATTSRELTCTLGALSETLTRLSERGVDPGLAARHLHLTVPVGTSYFLEIAKLRALRHLIPQLLSAYGVDGLPSTPIRAVTSRRMQTRYDAHMNMVRATTAAASAIIGGADSLEIRSFDDEAGGPSAFGRRIAQNTALILELESRLHHVQDPAAGSYYIEKLTDHIAERAWAHFQELEAKGGLFEAIRSGGLQQEIRQDRQRLEAELATREKMLVGINHYPDPRQKPPPEAPASEAELPLPDKDHRAASIPELREALQDGWPLAELIQEPSAGLLSLEGLDRSRLAEPFEALREATDRHAVATGQCPTALLLPVGPPAVRSARATFARNLLGCAGFELHEPVGFDHLEEALLAVEAASPEMVVLCTSDELLEEYLSRTVEALNKSKTSPLLLVAAHPQESPPGADLFLYEGVNVLQTLQKLQGMLAIGTS